MTEDQAGKLETGYPTPSLDFFHFWFLESLNSMKGYAGQGGLTDCGMCLPKHKLLREVGRFRKLLRKGKLAGGCMSGLFPGGDPGWQKVTARCA